MVFQARIAAKKSARERSNCTTIDKRTVFLMLGTLLVARGAFNLWTTLFTLQGVTFSFPSLTGVSIYLYVGMDAAFSLMTAFAIISISLQSPKLISSIIWTNIIICGALNIIAIANTIMTVNGRTESVQKCKQMNYDPLTNQTVLSEDLCLLKWCLAMTAVAVSFCINLLLDILFILMLRVMSKEITSKFLFPYDDPEKPLHFRTQRLRDTMVKGEPTPAKAAYPLHDRQLSQSSIADILTGGQSSIKAA